MYVCLVLINSATTKRTTMKIFPSTPTHIPKVLIPMCAGSSNCFWPHNDTGKLSNKYTFTINIQWRFAFYSVGVPFLLGSEFLFSVSLFPGCCFFNSPLPCMLVSAAVFLIKWRIHRKMGISFRALYSPPSPVCAHGSLVSLEIQPAQKQQLTCGA